MIAQPVAYVVLMPGELHSWQKRAFLEDFKGRGIIWALYSESRLYLRASLQALSFSKEQGNGF